MKKGKTLFEKIWEAHEIKKLDESTSLLYIDTHLIHEVTSPQAFGGLERRGLKVRNPHQVVATLDHNVPTKNQHLPIKEVLSKKQVDTLIQNTKEHNIELYGLGHPFQGIVHVIGPELGITLPGKTIVCGDSHTSTHGALGAIAFGIGTSEVEMVLATQSMIAQKPKTMKISVNGILDKNVTPKDVILHIISKMGVNGGTGYFIEYCGSVFENMSMEGRLTVCNMSIEMGARGGMIAPDETTFKYLKGREFSPKGSSLETAITYWKSLVSDEDATYNVEHTFEAVNISPMITYGTNPGMGMPIDGNIPKENDNAGLKKALEYMDLHAGETLLGKQVDYVFLGSCTNSRIEDFRSFAEIIKGKKVAKNITAWLVPGSKLVEQQIIKEGIKNTLEEAGFVLREPGCSACLGMNEDKIPRGKYAVSVSNRNFEGRQGPGSRTFLASPLTAAATAIEGRITDPRKYIS